MTTGLRIPTPRKHITTIECPDRPCQPQQIPATSVSETAAMQRVCPQALIWNWLGQAQCPHGFIETYLPAWSTNPQPKVQGKPPPCLPRKVYPMEHSRMVSSFHMTDTTSRPHTGRQVEKASSRQCHKAEQSKNASGATHNPKLLAGNLNCTIFIIFVLEVIVLALHHHNSQSAQSSSRWPVEIIFVPSETPPFHYLVNWYHLAS